MLLMMKAHADSQHDPDFGRLLPDGRSYRVVPNRHLWERPGEGKLMLVVPLQKVLDAPEADRDGRVDTDAFERYWADDAE